MREVGESRRKREADAREGKTQQRTLNNRLANENSSRGNSGTRRGTIKDNSYEINNEVAAKQRVREGRFEYM